MGNCFPGDTTTTRPKHPIIKVITHTGGIMELHPPLTAESITNGFPNHALHPTTTTSPPLLHTDPLLPGHVYRLRPLHAALLPSPPASYRMSSWTRRQAEMFPGEGVWKVRLVIGREQLSEILALDWRTEELIESVRVVANCRSVAASVAGSDQCSVVSSRKAYSDSMG